MTRHKSSEERIDEIIKAAIDEVDCHGLAELTMEGIIARTSLSKGGVYRFFKNKGEVVRALAWYITDELSSVDIEECLSWGLGLKETVLRRFVHKDFTPEGLKLQRVILQLIPEILKDEGLHPIFAKRDRVIEEQYLGLSRAVMRRDGREFSAAMEEGLVRFIHMGQAMAYGLTLMGMRGVSLKDLESLFRHFLDVAMEVIEQRQATS